jgi:hypothetical protein
MDKKQKQHRQKFPTREEIGEEEEVTPPGASFDTEQGRAAQGMRHDIAEGGGDTVARKNPPEPKPQDQDE